MTFLGFHASHEQVPPGELLRAVVHAEAAGFTAAMCSDHLAPWSVRQGQSGFAWSWLGAALQATSLPFGVVTAPGYRYHPAVTAQAIATLAEMYPGRFWAALGSGEAMNEHVTGQPWPDKPTRDARLLECAGVIRDLLRGDEVDHSGQVVVHRARLWTLPSTAPPLVGAAVSAATAHRVGAWADGMITINQPVDDLRRVIDAFREGGGSGKPVYVQVHLSWDPDESRAVAMAHDQWRSGALEPELLWTLQQPEDFDGRSERVSADDVRSCVIVSADLAEHAARLEEIASLGVDGLYLHHVGRHQHAFIDAFGERVLPQLIVSAGSS